MVELAVLVLRTFRVLSFLTWERSHFNGSCLGNICETISFQSFLSMESAVSPLLRKTAVGEQLCFKTSCPRNNFLSVILSREQFSFRRACRGKNFISVVTGCGETLERLAIYLPTLWRWWTGHFGEFACTRA
jgi:hypothetical protein